ncbi:deoxyhypusine synthase [Candidatus Pacearchaeota archaeon CG10_big_fil_rev_8_21_14_0_10_31_24]|nr:MAG: deoxyhypusine synthase [Candidatus Pacearchaeota archaeon CG10_big_fil_rev_8_21_14_0_10_31_24]
MDKKKIARENLLRDSVEIDGISIEGYDFSKGVDYSEIVKSYSSSGFQASNLSRAIEIVNKMIAEKATIFLGYTSNMVSSGLRDVFRYLIQENKVNVVVTTAGGIEEDIIKCFGDFKLGDFRANGNELRDKGINRIGNIFVPNSRYVKFEEFVQPILEELYLEQKKSGKVMTSSDLIWKLGEKIGNEKSIYYWAWKNKIRVYCPALTDGALGDNIYFFKYKHEDFILDIAEDTKRLNDTTIGLEKSGLIILGSGVVKHAILNANMLRNGAEYAVYINTAQEFDGSDAGALPEEAISWGKIQKSGKSESVKVFADATIVFPLLVAKSFAKS